MSLVNRANTVPFHFVEYDSSFDPVNNSSERAISEVTSDVTDIFVLAHGWQHLVDEAKQEYSEWVTSMSDDSVSQQTFRTTRSKQLGQQPNSIIVGLHWPSRPKMAARTSRRSPVDEKYSSAAEFLADQREDVAEIADVLAEIDEKTSQEVQSQKRGIGEKLQETLQSILLASSLDERLGFPYGACARLAAATPQMIEALKQTQSTPWEGLVKVWSFARMRDRAGSFGNRAANDLLRDLQTAAPHARLHVIGHSFGCIVASSSICGASGQGRDSVSVHSVVLLQGAMSLWSFCKSNPTDFGKAGEFSRLPSLVGGAFAATQSEWDRAVGWWYPIAAHMWELGEDRQEVNFPVYGALGTWGAQGNELSVRAEDVHDLTKRYAFLPNTVHNINCSSVINNLTRDPKSGAHSDLLHPEVMQLVYEAAASEEHKA